MSLLLQRDTPPHDVDHVTWMTRQPVWFLILTIGRASAINVYRKSYFAVSMLGSRR
jgi:hypothetical protein